MSLLRNILGSNTAAVAWAESAADFYDLTGFTRSTLYLVATNTCFKLWRKFFIHIAAIAKKLGCCRTSVNKALKVLRDLKLISYDGQVHVGKIRPVAVYRLSGTPECPLPEWVVDAREAVREPLEDEASAEPLTCESAHRTVPTCGYAGFTQEPSLKSQDPDIYRPALPVKTGPQAEQNISGSVRRPPHLRWLRELAGGLLERRGAPVPNGAPQGSYGARRGGTGGPTVGAAEAPCSPIQGAVTYCHPPTTGATVTPFTDPALGALPRDTRLLYLGLLNLHTKYGDRTPCDAFFLKAEIFRYDEDINQREIRTMLETLSNTGKIHLVSGDIVLSDPPGSPTTSTEIALFDLKAAASAGKTTKTSSKDAAWAFECFWSRYPRRTGKGAARKAFAVALAAGVPSSRIIEATESYAERCQLLQKEPQFVPHPATWLNQERWDDDEEQAPKVRSKVDEALRSGMELIDFYQQQEAIDFNGPKELGW